MDFPKAFSKRIEYVDENLFGGAQTFKVVLANEEVSMKVRSGNHPVERRTFVRWYCESITQRNLDRMISNGRFHQASAKSMDRSLEGAEVQFEIDD